MKWNVTIRFFILMFCSGISLSLVAQQPLPPPPTMPWPGSDTFHRHMDKHPGMEPMYNVGFDVIITNDGNIVYGLVKEVDELYIKYKRTDIPDGPIYTLRKSDVYAISYRNQVKEFIPPGGRYVNPSYKGMYDSKIMLDSLGRPIPGRSVPGLYTDEDGRRISMPYSDRILRKDDIDFSRNAMVRVGLGFIRGFTKVKNADDFNSKAAFPDVSVSYDKLMQPDLRVGLMLTFGSNKFSGETFSSYDSTNISSDIKESIFSLMLYGKYAVGNKFSNLRPYILGGIGINSSSVDTENRIKFTNDNSQVLRVNSGGRSVGLGILARVGADYFFNYQYGVYADVGVGPSVIQVGGIINIQ